MFNFRTVATGLVFSLYSIFMIVTPAVHLNFAGVILSMLIYLLSVVIPVWLWIRLARRKKAVEEHRISFTIAAGVVTIVVLIVFYLISILNYYGVL